MAKNRSSKSNRKLVRTLLSASLLIVIGAGFSASTSSEVVASTEVFKSGTAGYMKIVVASGESVWSIASMLQKLQKLDGSGRSDLSSVVDQIMATNGLTSTDLEPGASLWVPLASK